MSVENILPPSLTPTVKVYYHVDDDATPYVSILPSHPRNPTLGDFKKVLPRKGFQYFLKLIDPDIQREVKKELVDDEDVLTRSDNGQIELFLRSSLNGGGGTLERGKREQKRRVGKERNQLQGNYDTYGGWPLGAASSIEDTATLVSKRAGERLADYTSASEEPYTMDEHTGMWMSSSGVDARDGMCRRRKPRKNGVRKAYVPSTIGSQPESSGTSLSLPRILEIRLHLGQHDNLGISVVSVEGSILVSDVNPDGIVARDGRIDVGDQIVKVNTRSFENLTDTEAIHLLRRVAAAKKPLTLYVAKRGVCDETTDALSALACETMPLDISVWVENAVHCTQRERYLVDDSSDYGVGGGAMHDDAPSMCIEDDEEERVLYAERRNGVGMRHGMVQGGMGRAEGRDTMERRRLDMLPASSRHVDNNESIYSEGLHAKSPPFLIACSMARPDSGLDVKNRKWLKILVPLSFIGGEMVEWLQRHVEGCEERKAAKAVAALLLQQGLIKHVVTKHDFTEKCYYVFDDCVLKQQQRPVGEVGEETTHSGPPTSTTTGDNRTQMSHVPTTPLLPPRAVAAHNETWPFSPITVVNNKKEQHNAHREDCESEYASMGGVESYALSSTVHSTALHHPPPNTPLSPHSTLNEHS